MKRTTAVVCPIAVVAAFLWQATVRSDGPCYPAGTVFREGCPREVLVWSSCSEERRPCIANVRSYPILKSERKNIVWNNRTEQVEFLDKRGEYALDLDCSWIFNCTNIVCAPGFLTPVVTSTTWSQTVQNQKAWIDFCDSLELYQTVLGCINDGEADTKTSSGSCASGGGGQECDETVDQDYDGWDQCEDCDDTYYDPYNTCSGPTCDSCSFDEDCYECDLTSYCEVGRCWATTPILIDINGDGYHLTSAAGGVAFDMSGYGSTQPLSWTAAGSDDAWLVLDRNGNGVVDNGKELFGSATPQARTGNAPNGFNALAHYDRPLAGGNGDGVIDSRDGIFTSLRLWQDLNHNGISEPGELHTLPQLGVSRIDLDYKESRRTDQYGNRFRYRAKAYDLHGAHVGRWAWDVSLVTL